MEGSNRSHPVFVSHTKEIEQMLYFGSDLQHRLDCKGKNTGVMYECLKNVRRKCTDLLLKMYAEDSNIILMNDLDAHWTRLLVNFVKTRILSDQKKAG